MIEINHLRKEFDNVIPLKDVCAKIEDGEVISIIGPSGTGKSTLLRCMNLLETPTSGEISIDGVNVLNPKTDIHKVRRGMGMVFQSFNLFSHLTVIENIMLGPKDLLGMTHEEAYSEGMKLLRMVGLAEKALDYPDSLSGGQKQRVAIARTLAMKPSIVLFDEPTSALDPTMVGEVLSVIRNLADQGLTMLIVTHEMKFARDVSTRVFFMNEGVIYEDGTPEQIFDHPQKEKTQIFIRRLRSLELTFESQDFDSIGSLNEIEEFARRQFLPEHRVRDCRLLFEELLLTNLMIYLSGEPMAFPMKFNMTVSEVDQKVEMTFEWGGKSYDPVKQGDEIAARIIERMTEEITHSYQDNCNVLKVVIRK